MEMIVISKTQFEGLFKVCLDKLALETLREKEYFGSYQQMLTNLHRKFHYEISKLRDQLEKG